LIHFYNRIINTDIRARLSVKDTTRDNLVTILC